MRRSLLSAATLVGLSVAALAVGDVPTRYSGAFPSDGIRTNITGTFTGKSLNFHFTSKMTKAGRFRRSFAGSCRSTATTSTCSGRITGSGSDTINVAAVTVVTWSAGRPVSLSISK